MGLTNLLTVVDTDSDGIALVTVAGAIDAGTVTTLNDTLETVIARAPKALVVDLTAVDFLSSAGIQCLSETHEQLGESVVVVAAAREVLRPLTLTRLTQVLTIVPTVAQAQNALRTKLD